MSKKTSRHMTKSTVKKLGRILSAALAIMMVFTLAMPAFADDPWRTGTETNPATAAGAKVLRMPEYTPTPAAKFTFRFNPFEVDGSKVQTDLDAMPIIGEQKIEFGVGDAGTATGGIKTVIKETGSIFENVNWKHAGEYYYIMYEEENTTDKYPIPDATKEGLTYTKASYKLQVIVRQGTNNYFVESVVATKYTDEKGDPVKEDKVDPTPGGPSTGDGYSNIRFINNYWKNNGGTNPLTDTVLAIKNTVSGDLSDTNKLFTYTFKVYTPETIVSPSTAYKACVIQTGTSGDVIIPIDSSMSVGPVYNDGSFDHIKVTVDAETGIRLKHNQRLAFYDMPIGAGFTVTQYGELKYVPSYALTIDGLAKAGDNAAEGATLTVPKTTIGDAENSAIFSNVYDKIVLTGIIVNNLPYISLISVALILLLGYIGLKVRRSARTVND